MNKLVVIYKSKYGSAGKYAEWLARELKSDMLSLSDVTLKNLAQYETVAYLGGLYAGGMNGFPRMKKLLEGTSKKLILCPVGASDASQKEQIEAEVCKKNLSPEMKGTPCFFLRGAMDYQAMNTMDKLMMKMLRRMLLKKPEAERGEQEKTMLECFYDKNDWTKPENLAPILEYIKNA